MIKNKELNDLAKKKADLLREVEEIESLMNKKRLEILRLKSDKTLVGKDINNSKTTTKRRNKDNDTNKRF